VATVGRPKKPVAVIKANGRSKTNNHHYAKAELAEREEQEIKPSDSSSVMPDYIAADKDLAGRFDFYVSHLQSLGIWDVVDSEELARYITSEDVYEALTIELRRALSEGRLDDAEGIQRQQDKAYRQAHSSASSLGLNISGRCKLVIPKAPVEQATDY
jgi:hypothetical protein